MPRSHKKLARKNRRSLPMFGGIVPPPVYITGTGAGTPTTSKVATFSGAVMLTGQPTRITAGGSGVTLTQLTTTTVKLSGDHTATGQAYIVPELDPAIRTAQGGFVAPVAGTF